MVEALVQNHKIVLQNGVVIFDANGNIVSTFGGGGLTDTQLRATPVPVSVSGSATAAKQDTQITAEQAILAALNARLGKGAANLATSEVTSSGSAQTLVIARPTRRSVLVRNDGSAADAVRVGEATVTSSHGVLLLAGQSTAFTFVGLIQVIATSGTPVVTVSDEYD